MTVRPVMAPCVEGAGEHRQKFSWPFNFGPYIETCFKSKERSGVQHEIGHDDVTLVQGAGDKVAGPIKIYVSYDVPCTWWPS